MTTRGMTIDLDDGAKALLSKVPPTPPKELPPNGKRTLGEWAVLKGHCHFTHFAERVKAKRPYSRGDRHTGPNVSVIRSHLGIKAGQGDPLLTEEEYVKAVTESVGLLVGDLVKDPPALVAVEATVEAPLHVDAPDALTPRQKVALDYLNEAHIPRAVLATKYPRWAPEIEAGGGLPTDMLDQIASRLAKHEKMRLRMVAPVRDFTVEITADLSGPAEKRESALREISARLKHARAEDAPPPTDEPPATPDEES